MADYISREAAIEAVKHAWAKGLEPSQYIEILPAADVAPVVRCKDCQNWKQNVGFIDSPNGHCFEHDIDTNGQDFCSYGERKDNDEREP